MGIVICSISMFESKVNFGIWVIVKGGVHPYKFFGTIFFSIFFLNVQHFKSIVSKFHVNRAKNNEDTEFQMTNFQARYIHKKTLKRFCGKQHF